MVDGSELGALGGKAALKSKAVIGGAIAMIPAVVDVLNHLAATPLLPPHAAAVISLVGGSLAIVGRFAAKYKITSWL